mgnify:CR=1 FL=1
MVDRQRRYQRPVPMAACVFWTRVSSSEVAFEGLIISEVNLAALFFGYTQRMITITTYSREWLSYTRQCMF